MDGEFRLFLALLALIGWIVLELTRGVLLLVRDKMLAGLVILLMGWGAWLGGGLPALLLLAVVILLWQKKSWRWYVIVGGMLFLVGIYALWQEKIWHSVRAIGDQVVGQRPEVWGVWAVTVFFRPWYGGYMAALMLWGAYLAYGRYPATFWYRIASKPLVEWILVFVGLTGALALGWRMNWFWFTHVVAGPWAGLLTFFAGRGLMTVRVSSLGRRLPLGLVVSMVMSVMLWLGEDFLTVIWVLAGVGLVSFWFVRKKETR